MLKKILSVTVALAMCLVLSTVMPLADETEALDFKGEGSEEKPYLIETAEDLKKLAEIVNDEENDCSGLYFRLENDIDLSGICRENVGEDGVSWVPIGADSSPSYNSFPYFSGTAFSGIFDGADKEISGLYINAPDSDYQGLFGYISNGTVKNLSVDGYIVGATSVGGVAGYNSGIIENCSNIGTVLGNWHVGGIAGYNSSGTIENCSNAETVSGIERGGTDGNRNVGGIVGYNNRGIIENCSNTGTVSGRNDTGGVVGINIGGTIENCFNTGMVSYVRAYDIGGIVGFNDSGRIENCCNTGTVSGIDVVGGIVSGNDGGTIKNCSNTGTVSALTRVGGVAGHSYRGIIENCSNLDTVSGSSRVGGVVGDNCTYVKDCSNIGTVSGDRYVGGVVGCNNSDTIENCSNAGTVSGSSEVGGVAGQLINSPGYRAAVKDCYNTGDVQGSSYVGGAVGCIGGSDSFYSGEKCYVTNCCNTGTVSGDSYVGGVAGYNSSGTIDDCSNTDTGTVSGSSDSHCVGGVMGYNDDGTIVNCSNAATVSGYWHVGGIVGYNSSGTMESCSNTDTGTISGSSKSQNVGGVVGWNDNGAIENCSNAATVSGLTDVGGVVGVNYYGTITNCFNTGTVSYPYAPVIGGVVGGNIYGTIENCFNTGTVSGSNIIGGVVANNNGYIKNCFNIGTISGTNNKVGGVVGWNISTIKNCFNAGTVSGNCEVGGIVGEHGIGTIENCYNTGKVSGSYEVGGITGYNVATIEKCYNTGDVSGEAETVGGIVGHNQTSTIAVQNCYYLENEEIGGIGDGGGEEQVYSRPGSDFTSGEIAYILQSLQEARDGLVWGQRLTAESEHNDSPILINDETEAYRVLKTTFIYNDSSTVKYANPNTSFAPPIKDLLEPPEGYVLGWTTKSDGNIPEFIGTVTVDDEDNTVFYGILVLKQDPEFDPPKARERLVYDGTEQELITAGSAIGGTMVYSFFENESYSENIPVGTDAGTYTVWYKVKGDDNYNDTEPESVEVTISKAYSYVKTAPEPIDREYDGEDKPLVTEGTAEGGIMVYSLSEGVEYSENIPMGKETGMYTVYYKVIGDSNHYDSEGTYKVTVIIFSAGQEFKPPVAKEPAPVHEPNTPQELVEPGWASNGTMQYRLPEDEEYSDNIPTGINAGEYTVYYMVKGNYGYNDIGPNEDEYYVTAAIAKADPIPPETNLTATVGQTLADIEPQLPEGYAWVDRTQSVGSVGEKSFAATFTPKDTKNFNTLDLMLTVKVTAPEQEPEPEPQDPEFTPPKAREGLVYDRTEQELITAGSAVNGTMVYKLDEERETVVYDLLSDDGYSTSIPTGVDAGEYTVWYKIIGDEGYNDTEPKSLTVEIAKANPTPPKTDLTATVGQTLTDIEPQLPEGYAWVDRTQSVGDVGENPFAATFTPKDTKNFNILEDLTLIVKVTAPEPQTPEFTPPKAKENLIYDSTEQELIAAGTATGGTMVYKVEEKEIATYDLVLPDPDSYSDTIPVGVDAGEYIVWYKVIGDEGYNGTEPESLTVEIAKADPTPPKTDLTATVGQTLADIEPQLPEGYAWVDREQSVGDVGENHFAATFTPKDTKNFNTLKNLTLIVKVTAPEPEPQDPEVTPPTAREGLVYDRTEQKLINEGSATGGTMVYKAEKKEKEEQETAIHDLILPDAESYSTDIPTGIDAGEYTVWYKVIGDEGYNDTEPESLTVEIAKADPIPPETDLTATVGQTLADVELPKGFAWVDDTQSVGNVGTNYFPAIFTPADTRNFNTLERDLPVKVTNPKEPAETTTTTAAAVTTTTDAAAEAITTEVTNPETTAAQTEITTTATTTSPEVVTESPSTTSPPTEVMDPEDEDKIPNTGIILIVAPFAVSMITVVVSRKRK